MNLPCVKQSSFVFGVQGTCPQRYLLTQTPKIVPTTPNAQLRTAASYPLLKMTNKHAERRITLIVIAPISFSVTVGLIFTNQPFHQGRIEIFPFAASCSMDFELDAAAHRVLHQRKTNRCISRRNSHSFVKNIPITTHNLALTQFKNRSPKGCFKV